MKKMEEIEIINWNARTPNAHIAKIAALPRVDRFCVFSQPLFALIKCWNAATSAICRNVSGKWWTVKRKRLKVNLKDCSERTKQEKYQS